MKTTLKGYSVFLLSFFFVNAMAQKEKVEFKFEKTKAVSKSYSLSSGDRVSFDNRFGDIKINTWDKSEIKVDIVMTGSSNSEEVAQELLDRLNIEEGKDGDHVHFKTKITDTKESNRKGQAYNNTRFSTNYTVYMPSQNKLSVENEFGKTFVPDYKGEITIHQKFGQLVAGRLDNVKKIHVEFSGGTTIESVTGGEIDFRFSRSQVNRLEGSIKANFEHAGGVKLKIDNSLKELTIKNVFTPLYLEVNTAFSARYKVHTNFEEFTNQTTFPVKEEEEESQRRGPKFDHDYSGQSGSGSASIKIDSQFGPVKMGHNISFDVNAKEEKKAKAKTRAI